jgi:transcriptional regulator with XRE-family HTH domain
MTDSPLDAGVIPSWTLGDRLKKAREFAGLKQPLLASELGIARSSITNYETDRTTPSKAVIMAWALRCGVPYQWLRTGKIPTSAGKADLNHYSPLRYLRPLLTAAAA